MKHPAQTAGGQPFTVGADSERANSAEVNLLPTLVGVERLGVERAELLAAGDFPLLEHSGQIAAQHELPLRMKCHTVYMPRVTRELAD